MVVSPRPVQEPNAWEASKGHIYTSESLLSTNKSHSVTCADQKMDKENKSI
jgi:hypothetical protein